MQAASTNKTAEPPPLRIVPGMVVGMSIGGHELMGGEGSDEASLSAIFSPIDKITVGLSGALNQETEHPRQTLTN
jgi:hypothetical protein